MSKKEEQKGKDLMAINLEALVSEAKENTPFEGEDKQVQETSVQPLQEEGLSSEDTSSWSNFHSHIERMKEGVTRNRKKAYYIDENIIDVIKSCDFGKTSITNVINAALRSFIDEHKQQLKGLLKPSPKLIIEE